MGQIFTVHLSGADFNYQLIKLNQVNRKIESQILLQGTTVTLCKDERGWSQKESSVTIVKELVQAIGNSISLRYRI